MTALNLRYSYCSIHVQIPLIKATQPAFIWDFGGTSKYSTFKFSNLSAQDVRPASLPVVLCLSLTPYADGRSPYLL